MRNADCGIAMGGQSRHNDRTDIPHSAYRNPQSCFHPLHVPAHGRECNEDDEPPRANPAPDTTTRPPLQRASSQSLVRPPNNAPSAPPASPHTPNCRPMVATDSPCVRSRNLGAQAMSPFTANVTSAPPTNIQI